MRKIPAGSLLALALLADAFFPRAVTEGAFSDSLAYAALARNLAEGIGSFWQPWFQQAEWYAPPLDEGFYAHPPLQFGLHSLLYRLFGPHWATDRLAAGLTFALGALLLRWAWQGLARREPALEGSAWMAQVAWLLLPVVSWAAPYCMLESSLSLFCLGACGAVPRAEGGRRAWLLLCGLLSAGAFLVKGPAGLFPLAAPLGFWLLSRQKPWPLWACLLPLLPLLLGGALLGAWEPSRAFFLRYAAAQLAPSLGGQPGLLPGAAVLLRNLISESALLLGGGRCWAACAWAGCGGPGWRGAALPPGRSGWGFRRACPWP